MGMWRTGDGSALQLRCRTLLCWMENRVLLSLETHFHTSGVLPTPPSSRHAMCAGLGKHWDRVLSTLDDMAAAGVPWDAYTASALLSACQACGRWQQALEWFQRAREVPGLQLNVVHYTTLMSCLQKAGQVRC